LAQAHAAGGSSDDLFSLFFIIIIHVRVFVSSCMGLGASVTTSRWRFCMHSLALYPWPTAQTRFAAPTPLKNIFKTNSKPMKPRDLFAKVQM
jgi:hypothetical protein